MRSDRRRTIRLAVCLLACCPAMLCAPAEEPERGWDELNRAARRAHDEGRTDEAMGWHGAWGAAWGTEFIWMAPAHWRLGRILEADAPEEAARHYESFVARWRDADPALQPMVEDARKRLARLIR